MLGPAEIRGGFSGGQELLDDAVAAQLARPDPKTELVLVGAEPLPPGEAMIAGLARARIVPGTRQAEYAILLGNYVAGLGLGRHLMQKLVKWSRGRYLDRLDDALFARYGLNAAEIAALRARLAAWPRR